MSRAVRLAHMEGGWADEASRSAEETGAYGRVTGAMQWRGPYQVDTQYYKHDVVPDEGYLMIANKDTQQKAAPVPTGEPFWFSGVGDAPAWVVNPGPMIPSLITGSRYTAGESGYIKRARVWLGVTDGSITYDVWFQFDPLTSTPDLYQIGVDLSPSVAGWLEIPVGLSLIPQGRVIDLLLVHKSQATPTIWQGYWDQKNQNGAPSEGEVNWHSNQRVIRFHHLDKNDVNRQTQLEATPVGAEMQVDGVTYTITSVNLNASDTQFEVTPASRPAENEKTFTFTYGAAIAIPYEQITDHYLPNANAQGLYSETGLGGLITDNNLYAVDLRVQDALIPTDWDFMAFSG